LKGREIWTIAGGKCYLGSYVSMLTDREIADAVSGVSSGSKSKSETKKSRSEIISRRTTAILRLRSSIRVRVH
jgi:hypothetical protein